MAERKLTRAQALEIRRLAKLPKDQRPTLKEIGKRYGVSPDTVARIRDRERYEFPES